MMAPFTSYELEEDWGFTRPEIELYHKVNRYLIYGFLGFSVSSMICIYFMS